MSHEATELQLYIENDGGLYRQQGLPILKNLATKVASGKYEHDKAVKLYMHFAESGAKKYAKEFGGGEWQRMFPVPVRKEVAIAFAKDFERECAAGQYAHLIPKKYQPKPAKPSAKPRRRA